MFCVVSNIQIIKNLTVMKSVILIRIFFISTILVFLLGACDSATDLKNEESLPENKQETLKASLNKSAEKLYDAVTAISTSEEFKLMTEAMFSENQRVLSIEKMNEAAENRYDSMQINLSDISGVYEYSWKRVKRAQFQPLRFFDRIADNDNMIIHLPVQKVKNFHRLFSYHPNDTLLENNFEINVSDYLLSRHYEKGLEYKLSSEMSLEGNSIGTLNLERLRNKINGLNFTSTYMLANGYAVTNIQNSGDTAISVYSITKDDVVLYEEKIISYKVDQEKKQREKIFSLTIGNVQIVRTPGPQGLDSAKVYVDGILQTNATVEIVFYQPDTENLGVTNQKRDVKITFDDGTSVLIRDLKENTIADIGTIFQAVRQAGFASVIVDRIASNIYWQKN